MITFLLFVCRVFIHYQSTIGKYHRSFRGYEQQDSHEFITILLDWLHEEMNRAPEKTPLKEQKNDGLSDAEGAARAWEDYKVCSTELGYV